LRGTNAGATRQFATASRWAPPGAAGRRRPGVEPNRQHARGVRLRVGERHAGFEPADALQIAEARENQSAAI
jgi:hypothetical protein